MTHDFLDDFVVAACVPLDSGHASGTLERADAILAAHPELAKQNIHTAAILGEDVEVRGFLNRNPGDGTAKAGPHGWDALTHLCFSKYLRLDRSRSAGFLGAALALLDAGASASTGFFSETHKPVSAFESALYGAAGIAHDAELTRLLLERGADPNDGEVVYHTPEGWDNAALKVLVTNGKVNSDGLSTMLLRKADWHDFEGIKWLLEQGANPNLVTHWGKTAFEHAVLRDNSVQIIGAFLDHGANIGRTGSGPQVLSSGSGATAMSLAARRGRGDVLELFAQRSVPDKLQGVERLLAACARNDSESARRIVELEPRLVSEIKAEGGKLLAEFAGNGNTNGVRQLLDLGVEVGAVYEGGDAYFGIARNSTALHVAAWRARHATVTLLIHCGAPLDARDAAGQTPLALAVRACVDSYWKDRRSPESVRALLKAGASTDGVEFPSGYSEVDELLAAHRIVPQQKTSPKRRE